MTDLTSMTLGERIRALRIEQKMTLTALAEASNISKGFLSQVERNKQDVPTTNILNIASALSVGVRYLLQGLNMYNAVITGLDKSSTVLPLTVDDPIDHPKHYTHGQIECIDIIESLNLGVGFCLGNAIKYIVRHDIKNSTIEGRICDLRKAIWYINRIIQKLEKMLPKKEGV